jgi:hypothetical protein
MCNIFCRKGDGEELVIIRIRHVVYLRYASLLFLS